MDLRIKTDEADEILAAADIAQYLKYEDNAAPELAIIDNMIVEARAHFEKITGLSFIEKTYQVLFKHDDKPYILPVSPVISVEKVEIVDIEGTPDELTLNSDYYKRGLYEIEIITEASSISNPFRTFAGKYDLKVEFKAGYGNSDTEALPGDLLGAIKKQVKQWYDNRDDFYEFNILGSINKILSRYRVRLL